MQARLCWASCPSVSVRAGSPRNSRHPRDAGEWKKKSKPLTLDSFSMLHQGRKAMIEESPSACEGIFYFLNALLREKMSMTTPSNRLLMNNNSLETSSFCISPIRYCAPKKPLNPKKIRLIATNMVDLLFIRGYVYI